MKTRLTTPLVAFLLFSIQLDAQMARLYTSRSGLPSSQVNDIYQDSKGFMWISTENGLSRFNGVDFSTFKFSRDKSNSIASDLVISVMEDSNGKYWVGTSAGLQNFDVERNSFNKIDLGDPENPNSDMYISAIIEAEICGQVKIIAASSGHGIYIVDPSTYETDKPIREKINNAIHSQFINEIFLDSQHRLWIAGDDGGLSIIDMNTAEPISDILVNTESDIRESLIITSFVENSKNGDVIIGTTNYGILIYEELNNRIRRAKGRDSHIYRVEAILKNEIYPQLGEMTYLLGIENGGIKVFDLENEIVNDMKLSYFPYNTSTWKIHSLIEDNQGNVWAGAYQTGVLVIPKSMYGFEYTGFTNKEGEGYGITSACVTSVTYDKKNKWLWVGTDGAGLFRINEDGTVRNFTNTNSGLSNNSIMSLSIDKRGRLWIATYLGGLLSWTPYRGFRQFADQEALDTYKTVSLAYDSSNDILFIGTHGYGMSVISLADEKVIKSFRDDDNKWISDLYLDSDGQLWVGTYNGPMLYDRRKETLSKYDIDKVLSTRVHSFCSTSDEMMWIGTGEGLVRMDKKNLEIKSYTVDDGLPSNVINGIREGSDGHLWIATLNGLSRFDIDQERFKNYYAYDGLQGDEFHSGASYVAEDGKMYFGGIKGLTSFYPHFVEQKRHQVPPVYFSELTVMNEAAAYDPMLGDDNILDKHITEATMITLPFDHNIFSLNFSVLEYTNPQKIVYSYMLEGIDNGWNIAQQDAKRATYTNVPAGRYTMKVKAFFDGEPEEFSYKEIGVRILPPWYRSFWAYICYFALACLGFAGYLQWRKKLKIRKKEMEESEIKELKLKMFTNISHEIRTPLTLVMNPLKKLREAEKDPKQKDLFNLMYRNSLRILRLVNQLLDMRKVDNGQMKLHFLETDVVYFIKDIMQSFDNLAVNRNIRFSISTINDVVNLWIDQGNFDKIIFNLLSNAFKYTPDGGEISISISSPQYNDRILQNNVKEYVEFTIENSGSYVEERHLDRLFDRYFQINVKDAKEGSGVGLNLSKMLVELHHGDIRAYNTGKGVAFSVRIPVGKEHLSEEEMTKPSNHKDLYTKAEYLHTSREDVTEPEKRDQEEIKQLKSKRNIILVDDDSEMRAYLKLELQSIYNVESSANAKDAWTKISTTVPDAVITDLVMDGMDGAELCAKIKKNPGTNHIPVLILTSSSDEQSIQRCIDSGADRFFTKPISLEILKGAVANAITARDTMRNKFGKDIDYKYQETQMSDSGNKLIDKVITAIRKNMDNPEFGVEDLSREVGMSRVHLNRKLKETMNISPSNLIKSIRLKQAAFLLINNKVNISEIAYKVGFSTHSYFSSSFHDYFGMTPKEFVAKYLGCKDEETLRKLFE